MGIDWISDTRPVDFDWGDYPVDVIVAVRDAPPQIGFYRTVLVNNVGKTVFFAPASDREYSYIAVRVSSYSTLKMISEAIADVISEDRELMNKLEKLVDQETVNEMRRATQGVSLVYNLFGAAADFNMDFITESVSSIFFKNYSWRECGDLADLLVTVAKRLEDDKLKAHLAELAAFLLCCHEKKVDMFSSY